MACFEVATILLPGGLGVWKRGSELAKELLDHAPKLKKYLEEAHDARKKLDALKARPKRKKKKDDDCQKLSPRAGQNVRLSRPLVLPVDGAISEAEGLKVGRSALRYGLINNGAANGTATDASVDENDEKLVGDAANDTAGSRTGTATYYGVAGRASLLARNSNECKKTAVFGVHRYSERLAAHLRRVDPEGVYETYNDPKLARVLPGEIRPQWMNLVSKAVGNADGYNIAITLDGLDHYGSTPEEIVANAVEEGGRLDARGLPLRCATCWEFRQVSRAIGAGERSKSSVAVFVGEEELDANPFG